MFSFKPSRFQVAVCIGLILVGVITAWFVWPRTDGAVNEGRTDQRIEDLKNQVSILSEGIETLSREANRKVVIAREEAQTEVADLGPDGVCDALNDELARYRTIRANPQGPDGHGD